MIKKIIALSFLSVLFIRANAQDDNGDNQDPMKGKFRKDNIFLGGSIGAGFSSGSVSIGANPEIGYTIAEWIDAGLGFNLNYSTLSADYNYYNPGIRQRAFNYGIGPFVRLYPVHFLFVQGQYEKNWTHYNLRDQSTGDTYSTTTNASSLIGGIGYTQRMVGQGSYYIMVGMDFLRDANSPYIDVNSYGQKRARPIIRAGFNFYLRPGQR